MADGKVSTGNYKGWLYKWTNYIKGYQKRWFVLSNSLLSYYRLDFDFRHKTQAEMAHTCRGTINLVGAIVETLDPCSFVITNGGTQTFYLKAASEVERQRWVTALELAKAEAIQASESDEDDSSNPPLEESLQTLKALTSKLEELKTCNDLVVKHSLLVTKHLHEFEASTSSTSASKHVQEKAALFKISSTAMVTTCTDFVKLAQTYERWWQRALQVEQDRRLQLEETVEALARQHNRLEEVCKKESTSSENAVTRTSDSDANLLEVDDDDDESFFDAVEDNSLTKQETLQAISLSPHHRSTSDTSLAAPLLASDIQQQHVGKGPLEGVQLHREQEEGSVKTVVTVSRGHPNALIPPITLTAANVFEQKKRRTTIPPKPNSRINLWNLMKNCIGRELSKIPLPVNINEPLTFCQVIIEDLQYSEVLTKAAECEDSLEQMAYVAAFTITPYAKTMNRTGKPFNPLLGETFEFDDTGNAGWRALAEQVGHHPPQTALFAEHKEWVFWQDYVMGSKFRGQYLQILPQGVAHLLFRKSGNHYVYKRSVISTVHNIIVGKLYVDHSGEMDIVNQTTKELCWLKYHAYSYFSREEPRRVTGVVYNSREQPKIQLTGTWDKKIEFAWIKGVQRGRSGLKSIYTSDTPVTIWTRTPLRPQNDMVYGFDEFACWLNEPEEGVVQTDCRLRPDLRLMENQDYDSANAKKLALEEKQRARRRQREADFAKELATGGAKEKPQSGGDAGWKPVWFKREMDPLTNILTYIYKGGYWEKKKQQDWTDIPDLW